MKKVFINLFVILIVALCFLLPFLVLGSSARFNWKINPQLEDQNKRTYTTKEFEIPTEPTKKLLIQSSVLLHYHDGKSFKDLTDLSFPEGKLLSIEVPTPYIMDLPDWGEAKVEKNGKQVRVYDKQNQPIYIFKDPFVISEGLKPYEIVNINDGSHIAYTTDTTQDLGIDKKIIRRTELIDECNFGVLDNQLYLELPKVLKNTYPLQAYDDVDTSSTNNKDSYLQENTPDTTKGHQAYMYLYRDNAVRVRPVMDWTLSSGSGSISSIRLYLYCDGVGAGSGMSGVQVDIHELTQVFIENEVTWNVYSTGNPWASPGGDFSGTIIDSIVWPNDDNDVWRYFDLGSGATNPISGLTWGSIVDLLIKFNTELTGYAAEYINSKEAGSNNPYLEIIYTPAVPPPSYTWFDFDDNALAEIINVGKGLFTDFIGFILTLMGVILGFYIIRSVLKILPKR